MYVASKEEKMNRCEICKEQGAYFYVRVQWGLLVQACMKCTEEQERLILTEHGAFASEIRGRKE
jgi:hypothetical protein